MAAGATGTPTSNFSIPKYSTSADAPNGTGFNSAMDAIDLALKGVDDAKLEVFGTPTNGQVPVWVTANSRPEWGQASSPSVTPVSFQSASSGAAFNITALGTIAWLAPRWEYADGTTSSVVGTVLVPSGVANATLRVLLAANATTGNARVVGFVASAQNNEQLAPATWDILNASAQTVTMPGTAWLRKDATFSLTGLTGGDLLMVAIQRLGADGADTLTANLALFGAWLEPA
jgi:hypothetical protein